MATYPPPPGNLPPYGYDPRSQKQAERDQRRAKKDIYRAQRDLYRQQARALRRSSILGPLLLVAIGVVFLLVQTGRITLDRTADLYSRWWPALFVAAGIVVLIEWGIDQATQREGVPVGRRSVGGGVVLLLILFAIAGGATKLIRNRDFLANNFSINPDNIQEFLGEKHEADQTIDQEFKPGTTLLIDNPHGDTVVNGTSTDNQIHISIHKQVYSSSDASADSRLDELNMRSATVGNALNLSLPSVNGGLTNISVTVPDFAATTVTANHGDVRVAGIRGAVSVTANHGDVSLNGITGAVATRLNHSGSSFSAHSVTGPVTVRGHAHDLNVSDVDGNVALEGEFYGDTHVEHARGTVAFVSSRTQLHFVRLDGELNISPDATLSVDQALGPFTLKTGNRNITLDRVSGDISVLNKYGTVDITSAPPASTITVVNRNGSVSVTLPEHLGYSMQADTTNGAIRNDFGLPDESKDRRNNMSGKVGAGGPIVHLSTTEGDIDFHKATIAPVPPTPPAPPRLTATPAPPQPPVAPPNFANSDVQKTVEEAKKAAEEAKKALKEAEAQVREAARQTKEAARQARKDVSNEDKK